MGLIDSLNEFMQDRGVESKDFNTLGSSWKEIYEFNWRSRDLCDRNMLFRRAESDSKIRLTKTPKYYAHYEILDNFNPKETEMVDYKPNADENNPTFTQRVLSPEQEKLFKKSNDLFKQIEDMLNGMPKSRLVAMALTNLEVASLIANKAISRMDEPTGVPPKD